MDQTHVMNLLVLGADSTVPVTAAASYIQSYTDLDDGAFSVCNDENLVLSAATVLTDARVAATGVKLVGRYGTKLVWSDMIMAKDLISFRGIANVAGAEQVTYVGYNGTSGAIEVINDNVYKFSLDFQQTGRAGQGMRDKIAAVYESDGTATGMEIAYTLAEYIRKTLDRQAEPSVKIEVINSAAVTVANGTKTAQEVTIVKGSPYITFETDMTYLVGGGSTLAVGDLLRIGAVGAGTTLTSPVYKVISKPSATVAKVDRPVTNASGIYDDAAGTSDIEVIPIASIANYGFKLSGIAPAYQVGRKPYKKVAFTVSLGGFGVTEVTYSTAMSLGVGVDKQIKDLEWFTSAQNGNKYRADYMFTAPDSRVVTDDVYQQIAISWASDHRSEGISGPGHNPKQLILAIDSLYDNTDANDIVIEVLDAFAGDVGFVASGLAK